MRQHIVRQGETLGSIAKRYTGDARRGPELLRANPALSATQGAVGGFQSAFRQNLRLNIPAGWGSVRGPVEDMIGSAPSGSPSPNNTPCSAGARITDVKPYLYVLTQEDLGSFSKIPAKFGMPLQNASTGHWLWQDLRDANADWPGGFSTWNGACLPAGIQAGSTMRVPASWGEPLPGVKIVEGKTPAVVGGDKKDGIDTVDYSDGGGSSNTLLWVILGVGGAVGLGLLATGALKTKKPVAAR